MRRAEMGQEKCPLAWRVRTLCAHETNCSHQTTGNARWEPQNCLPVADSGQIVSRELLQKAFDEGILCS